MGLRDIVNGGGGSVDDNLDHLWNETEAAAERMLLPVGTYRLIVENGKLTTSTGKGTPGYQIRLRVEGGEFDGRTFSHTFWLSGGALAYSKRDLQRLGINGPAQMRQPLPEEIVLSGRVVLRASDEGAEFNELRSFEVIERRRKPADPFAPAEGGIS